MSVPTTTLSSIPVKGGPQFKCFTQAAQAYKPRVGSFKIWNELRSKLHTSRGNLPGARSAVDGNPITQAYKPRVGSVKIWNELPSKLRTSCETLPSASSSVDANPITLGIFNSMLSWVEIITTPTADTPGTALLLHFHDKRYLIGNIHEGLTRALIQRGIKLSKVQDIFITGRVEWSGIGGLLGVIMSAADSRASVAASAIARAEEKAVSRQELGMTGETRWEKTRHEKMSAEASVRQVRDAHNGEAGGTLSADSKLTIHGGPNLTHCLASGRRYIMRLGLPLRVEEFLESKPPREPDCECKPDWVDDRVQVWKMAIAPTEDDEHRSILDVESPLKRTYQHFMDDGADASVPTGMTSKPTLADSSAYWSAENQKVREMVVSHMFDSSWRADCLQELLLADVQMPARIFTRDPVTQEIRPYHGPLPDGTSPVPPVKVLVRRPWPGAQIAKLPPTKPSRVAMSYIFRTHTRRGKFQPEKAAALKVPSGPLWRQLADGHSVQSADGQTVTPEMVLLDPREGSGVAVVDLPSNDYVHNLVERIEWQTPAVMNGVAMILWILGPGVGENKELQTFIARHGHLMHSFSSPDYCPNMIAFDSGASGAIQLHQINPLNHPIPVFDNVPLAQLGPPGPGWAPNVELIQAKRGMKVVLTPSVSFDKDQYVPPLDTVGVLHKTSPDVLRLAQVTRESAFDPEEFWKQELPSPNAEIICLGTGSALPSKYRNVSSTLLRVPNCGSYLLDCGENTLGQLRRIYRPKQLSELFRDLRLIWVSHLHADHHLGLPSVIKAWYEEVYGQKTHIPEDRRVDDLVFDKPDECSLVLVCSRKLHAALKEFAEVEDFGYYHLTRLIPQGITSDTPHPSILLNDDEKAQKKIKDVLRIAGLTRLRSCYVTHCVDAQAVSLHFPSGFKFSYSGDCRPSKVFARMGRNSTVLLHEATFDDVMRSDARAKKHSTTSEAIGVGLAMRARRILLTHFSQRYQKLPVMSNIGTLNFKLEEETGCPGEMNATEPNVDLAEGESSEPNASIPESVTDASFDPVASDSGSELPQTALGESLVSAKQVQPLDVKIGVAFDYMRVKVCEITHLEKFTPALLKLYERQEPEVDDADEPEGEDLKQKDNEIEDGNLKSKKQKLKASRKASRAEKKAQNELA